VWFCMWWTIHAACPDGPYLLPHYEASGRSEIWGSADEAVLNIVHKNSLIWP
jgi:hypothetical protein